MHNIFKIILAFVIFYVFLCSFLAHTKVTFLLAAMYKEYEPSWFCRESQKIIQKKRDCKDYTTSIFKILLTNNEMGIPLWSTYIAMLKRESIKFPAVDCVIGITSGGWLTAKILANILGKPCLKLKYSRYNKKNLIDKLIIYIKGHSDNVNVDSNEFQKISMCNNADFKTCLLIDDVIGSGATLRVCKSYLTWLGYKSIFTYAVSASKPHLVDAYYTNNYFVIFPWGLDV